MMSDPNLRLLIIDDEANLLEILQEELQTLALPVPHAITTRTNGREALELLKVQEFDAILSDIKMPEMSGLVLLEEMRKLQIFTPVIFLTGFADKENAVQALRLGAFNFIDKPWNPAYLKRTVQEAILLGRKIHESKETVNQILVKHPDLSDSIRERLPEIYFSILQAKLKNTTD